VEGFVDVEDGLDGVVAGRDFAELADGVAAGFVGDGDSDARGPGVDGYAEDDLRLWGVVDLHARLVAGVVREQQQEAAVERLRRTRGGEADGDRLSENCRGESEGEQRKSAHTGKYMHATREAVARLKGYAADGLDLDGRLCGVAGGRVVAGAAARLGPCGTVVCGGGDVCRGVAVL
jgi:hypothetical protein